MYIYIYMFLLVIVFDAPASHFFENSPPLQNPGSAYGIIPKVCVLIIRTFSIVQRWVRGGIQTE